MGVNPVYDMERSGHSRPEDNVTVAEILINVEMANGCT